MPVLEARNVSKHYQMGEVTVSALAGVSLAVDRGEFVAIMGPSGSGKSTLLHLIGGLDWPSEGEILIGDQPLSQLSDDAITLVRRRRVGFIFQFFNLLPTLTAEENVGLPLLLDGQPLRRHHDKIAMLLDRVGLADRRQHRPMQLSGGEQQRVAIARALVHDPDIVLADEPTGNLDTRTGAAILELLRHTCADLGATVLMVTHDPRAATFADRVIFLRDGGVVHELGAGQQSTEAVLAVLAALET